MSLQSNIIKYFDDGFTYLEIIEFLRERHGHHISLSTLKRHLKQFGKQRRSTENVRCSQGELVNVVEEELAGSGSGVGYRRIHRSILKKGVVCRRDDVRKIIKLIDPEGVRSRRRRRLVRRKYVTQGPNYVWHIDGHDKLKPFGFSIHGCIDGFSRRLMWLEVGTSNKNPEIIAKFYLDTVKEYGIPLQIKADDGSEHTLVHPIHVYLRTLDGTHPNLDAFSITSSPLNQRIEAFWSHLQRDRIGWWKQLFQDLVDLGLFSNDEPVLIDCIRFCYIDLLRNELKSILDDWNSHIIAPSRWNGPRGRPDTMYFLPHLYEKENYKIEISEDEIDDFYPAVTTALPDVSQEFQEFARTVIRLNGNTTYPPNNVFEATELYVFLREKIRQFS